VEFESLGHMGPVTHPDPVNEVIEQFLDREHELNRSACATGQAR
jgi:hypothetical protein